MRTLTLARSLAGLASIIVSYQATAWDCTKWISTVPGTECYRPLPTGAASNAAASINATLAPSAHATGGDASSNQQQAQHQAQQQSQQQTANASNAGNNQSLTYENNSPRIPVATAIAPLAAAPCMGSTGGGAQTGVLGVSFGTTRRDKTCEFRQKAAEADRISPLVGCYFRMKNDPTIADAMRAAGQSCEGLYGEVAAPEIPAPVPAAPPAAMVPVPSLLPAPPAPAKVSPVISKPRTAHKAKARALCVMPDQVPAGAKAK